MSARDRIETDLESCMDVRRYCRFLHAATTVDGRKTSWSGVLMAVPPPSAKYGQNLGDVEVW